MARKKKAALNKNPVIEPIKEEIEKTPIEEPTNPTVDGEKLVEALTNLETAIGKKPEPVETELPKPVFINEPIEIDIPEKKEEEVMELTILRPSQAQLAKLSKAGLRWYQRTGMLPK
jgi:hypothetical protein